MRRSFLLFVLIFIVGNVFSQRMLTLEQAVATALRNNYDIRLARNDSAVFGTDNDLVWGAFLPDLTGTVNKIWNQNNQRQKLADGSNRQLDNAKSSNLTGSVAMNWVLFDGLRMFATKEKVEQLVTLGGLQVRDQIGNTVAAVINNYYNVVQSKQQLKAVEEQMAISEERVKLADKKLSVGLGSKPELLQARVDLNAQKAAQLQQRTVIAQLSVQLNQTMGLPINTVYYEVGDSIPLNLGLEYGALAENLVVSNPTLQVLQKNITVADLTVKEFKADRFPIVTFNSSYNYSRLNNKAVVNPFTPLFSQNNGFNYGFGATIPIMNNFNVRRNIRQAKVARNLQQLTFDNQRSLIDVALSNGYKDYEYQKQALALEEENIELAKENVAIALARFRQGVSTFLELREAQISLAEAYNRLIAARYNTKLAETELLRLKGDLIR
ncbi:MAG: TolC family protein [Sphingobacteriales bacterium]|nr:MAG: TolC family protein [Sphingobacteriales bacterium]